MDGRDCGGGTVAKPVENSAELARAAWETGGVWGLRDTVAMAEDPVNRGLRRSKCLW